MRRLNRHILFGSAEPPHSLAKETVKGGVSVIYSQAVQFLTNTLSTIVLARLLVPDDFGLVGIVMVFVGFAERFKDAGLSMATIQRETINEQQISTLFWINLAIGVLIALILVAVAPLVGYFYERAEITGVFALLSFSFVFSGFSIQHQALMRRHLQFSRLAHIQIVATITRQLVSIILAMLGWDYMALVFGIIAFAVANTIGTFFYCNWLPGKPRKTKGVFSMLAFGGHMTIFTVITYITNNIGQGILGKIANAATVGNYTKARGILMLPLTQIRGPVSSVMTPVLSKLQNDPEKFRKYYYAVVFFMAFVTMPLTMVFMLYPKDIVLLYLGPKWTQAAQLFSIFCWYSLVYPVSGLRGIVLVSLGKPKRYSSFGFIHGIINIVAMLIGSYFGAAGIAWAFVIINYAIWVPTLFYCFKDTPLTVSGYFKACYMPLVVCLVGGGGVKLIDIFYWGDLGYWRILFGGLLFISFYALFWGIALKMKWQSELQEMLALAKTMMRKRKR